MNSPINQIVTIFFGGDYETYDEVYYGKINNEYVLVDYCNTTRYLGSYCEKDNITYNNVEYYIENVNYRIEHTNGIFFELCSNPFILIIFGFMLFNIIFSALLKYMRS